MHHLLDELQRILLCTENVEINHIKCIAKIEETKISLIISVKKLMEVNSVQEEDVVEKTISVEVRGDRIMDDALKNPTQNECLSYKSSVFEKCF